MLTMKSNLYNNEGTLSSQAQSLLSPKPAEISTKEWQLQLKAFRTTLSEEELILFKKLRKKESDLAYRKRHYEKVRERENSYKEKLGEEQKIRHRKHCKKHKTDNKEKYQQYNKEYPKQYRAENKEAIAKYNKEYRQHNKEKRNAYAKRYYQKNKKEILAKNKKWMDNKLYVEKNQRYIAMRILRSAVHSSFTRKGVKKTEKTEKLLGAKWDAVQKHFESLFTEGMSWSNRNEWHVDHIRPVSSFEDPHDPLMNHYTNLQPLWAKDNFCKGSKWSVDESNECFDHKSYSKEVQEARGTQKENNRRTGCKTPRVGAAEVP